MTGSYLEMLAESDSKTQQCEAVCREWMRGCSCAPSGKPWECVECTQAFHERLTTLLLRRCG